MENNNLFTIEIINENESENESESENEPRGERTYEQLLVERFEYEQHLYNTLVGHINGVYIYSNFVIEQEIPNQSSSFWDPVIVSLSQEQIEQLEQIECEEQSECFICKENENIFKKVNCCNNQICINCISIWFSKSVYCPFCKHDQRETVAERETVI